MTKLNRIFAAAALAASFPAAQAFADTAPTNAPTLADRLCRDYEKIETISCQVIKISSADGNTVRMLSRVHYKKPDRIHVDIVEPWKRRVIADGKDLYHHTDGARLGYASPIGSLEGDMLASLRNVPGTPFEHLMHFRSATEKDLPGTPDLPARKGYSTPQAFVVLSCNKDGQPARIEYFKGEDMKNAFAVVEYSGFVMAFDGCWIPCIHKSTVTLPGGKQQTETRKVTNLEVNKPIASGLFDASVFMKGIAFTNDFEKTLAK